MEEEDESPRLMKQARWGKKKTLRRMKKDAGVKDSFCWVGEGLRA